MKLTKIFDWLISVSLSVKRFFEYTLIYCIIKVVNTINAQLVSHSFSDCRHISAKPADKWYWKETTSPEHHGIKWNWKKHWFFCFIYVLSLFHVIDTYWIRTAPVHCSRLGRNCDRSNRHSLNLIISLIKKTLLCSCYYESTFSRS